MTRMSEEELLRIRLDEVEQQKSTGVSFTVPAIPPSVNHYKGTNRGRYYVRDEAKRFWDRMKLAVLSDSFDSTSLPVTWKLHTVRVRVVLGAKQKGDCDNFSKVILDGLVRCGVIKSDAQVMRLEIEKARDRNNPRTEIEILEY